MRTYSSCIKDVQPSIVKRIIVLLTEVCVLEQPDAKLGINSVELENALVIELQER